MIQLDELEMIKPRSGANRDLELRFLLPRGKLGPKDFRDEKL